MKEKFVDHRFSAESAIVVQQSDVILNEYRSQGYILTLRQLYYQFVARDLFPEDRTWTLITKTGKWVRDPKGTKNAPPNYKWLGGLVSDGRLAGKLDWEMIEDRGREAHVNSHWTSPADIIRQAAKQFRIDRWENQLVTWSASSKKMHCPVSFFLFVRSWILC